MFVACRQVILRYFIVIFSHYIIFYYFCQWCFNTFSLLLEFCYNWGMIRIIAGGKKHVEWCAEACAEFEKRLRKPYEIVWEFMDEDKLNKKLSDWPFENRDFVICCDERGKNISSDEFSQCLEKVFVNGKNVVILIGGAYGFPEMVREKADFVWSFSKLVFPHMIARLIVAEQVYRAQEIAHGGKYHHE